MYNESHWYLTKNPTSKGAVSALPDHHHRVQGFIIFDQPYFKQDPHFCCWIAHHHRPCPSAKPNSSQYYLNLVISKPKVDDWFQALQNRQMRTEKCESVPNPVGKWSGRVQIEKELVKPGAQWNRGSQQNCRVERRKTTKNDPGTNIPHACNHQVFLLGSFF